MRGFMSLAIGSCENAESRIFANSQGEIAKKLLAVRFPVHSLSRFSLDEINECANLARHVGA
jgi:hypothetical protein